MLTPPEGGSGAAAVAPESNLTLASPPGRADREPGPKLVVLIPALNEQETIARVVAEVPRRIPGIACVDVVVVDDGSDDLTADRAWAAGADEVARHPGNRGLVAAFNRGATEALARGADVIVTLDGDGQHDAALMPRLVAPVLAGSADLVVAARPLADPTQGSPVRRLGNRAGSWFARRALRVPLTDVTSGYRAFSREALLNLHVTSSYTYTLETLIQAAGKRLRMAEIVAPARHRTEGTSRMTRSVTRYIARTGTQAVRTALHANPLRPFGRAAASLGLAAVVATTWFLLSYADGGMHLPALLAAVLLAVGAAALLICGLLADGSCANRRLIEDGLHRIKRIETRDATPPAAGRATVRPAPSGVADESALVRATPATPSVP